MPKKILISDLDIEAVELKINTEERRHGLGSLRPSVLYRLEKTECIISRNLLLLPHDTSGGGGPSRYDEAPFSH